MQAGARPGMVIAEARMLLPGDQIRLEEHEPRQDHQMLRALGVWAQRFSPTVALDAPHGLALDIAGCQRLFRGEDRLLETLLTSLRVLGFTARGAIAPTFACASALARFASRDRMIVSTPEEVRAALDVLPVRALMIDRDTQDALDEIGIDRVGHVRNLPRSSLPSRFAEPLLERLDRALGQAIETIEPIRVRAAPRVERLFDGPTLQLEAIELTVRQLLEELTGVLLAKESGVRLLELSLERADLGPALVSLELTRPTRDKRHLWRLIAPRLERTHLGYGVEGVVLKAVRTARLPHQQIEDWTDAPGRNAHAEQAGAQLIDTLVGKLGAGRVRRVELLPSHVPERAWRERGVLDDTRADTQADMEQTKARKPPARTPRSASGDDQGSSVVNAKLASTAERPTTLFDVPQDIKVVSVTPDGPVMALRWLGQDLRVTACIGPERIAGEWWRHDQPTRDYFKTQDQHGRWLWVCREVETGRWFVHGIWV